MSHINWVGKSSNDERVGRGGCNPPACETRWIVPVKPYEPPEGSRERLEANVLMFAGVVVVLFSTLFMACAEMGMLR